METNTTMWVKIGAWTLPTHFMLINVTQPKKVMPWPRSYVTTGKSNLSPSALGSPSWLITEGSFYWRGKAHHNKAEHITSEGCAGNVAHHTNVTTPRKFGLLCSPILAAFQKKPPNLRKKHKKWRSYCSDMAHPYKRTRKTTIHNACIIRNTRIPKCPAYDNSIPVESTLTQSSG